MPKNFSRPPSSDKPKRTGHAFEKFSRKPWERRERGPTEDRGFRKPYGERREFGGAKRGFGERRDFRPQRFDDELFTAQGKVADIVGPDAQSRHDMLRKLWDFFRAEGLIVPAGHRPRANPDDWRHGEHEDRSERRVFRKPAGEHPTARKQRSLEGVPRRKFKETREERDEG